MVVMPTTSASTTTTAPTLTVLTTTTTTTAVACTKYVWYCGHRDHISCIPKTEELFQEHFYQLAMLTISLNGPNRPAGGM